MRKALPNILTGVLASLLACFLASCDLTGPQGEPGKDGEDAIGYTALAVNAAVEEKTGDGEDEPWIVKVSGVDISDPNVYRHIISGVAAAIKEGDIDLDLSGCTGETFAYIDGINNADKLRIVAITLPDSLTHIVDGREGYGAFSGYRRLGSVKAPELTYIGDYGFYTYSVTAGSNEALTEIDFPKVLTVGAYAFYRYPNLNSIKLPKAVSIGDSAFYGDASYSSLTVVNLPAAQSIGANAFFSWRYIASINLPEAITIGDHAFAYNEALITLSLDKCETIGASVFNNCTALKTLELENTAVTSIGASAFANCTSLETLDFSAVTSIGASAFANCTSLETLELTAVTTIGNKAFSNCTGLSSLKLGTTVPTAPTKSTSTGNGIFLQTGDSGPITISVPADKESGYATAGWKAVPQNDNTQADTIKFGTNHKAITISTY
jgi:hypothetical protein